MNNSEKKEVKRRKAEREENEHSTVEIALTFVVAKPGPQFHFSYNLSLCDYTKAAK